MKIWVFSVCHNDAEIIPWYLRHYGQFADRILVWDDASTDGSRELLKAHPSVTLFDCPWSGIDEDKALHHAYDVYPSARGKADWVIWADMDEFIYHPRLLDVLRCGFDPHTPEGRARYAKPDLLPIYQVMATAGFNMMGDGLPVNGYWHKQIWELNPMGVGAPVYSKPVVFRPEAKVRWVRGKHALEETNPIVSDKPLLKLLHYRYLGAAYTAAKNAKNYARCADKGPAWTCAPEFTGEHSATWAEAAKAKAFNVLESQL